MCMSSIPASVMAADQKDLKPSIGRVIRLIARWSSHAIVFCDFAACYRHSSTKEMNVG
jgi:hypothetical protein